MCPDPDDDQPAIVRRFQPCPRHRPNAGRELARHLISTCTNDGDLVAETHPTNDSVLAACGELGRRGVACVPHFPLAQYIGAGLRERSGEPQSGLAMRPCRPDQMSMALADHLGRAALVIAAPPLRPPQKRTGRHLCPGCPTAAATSKPIPLGSVLLASWRMLRPGGHLAVITTARHEHGQFIDPAPHIIHLAQTLKFRYSQHVIALNVPTVNGVLVQSDPCGLAQVRDEHADALPPAARVHADVCLFTKPHTAPTENRAQQGKGRA
ncbi:hypothetical protein EBO15_37075 [Actinomadura harenae]|uniref:SAM-dependent methyltransferase n=2 Tax=Actinomadura harenae TaxID=2483351 RepID=A0A3M2LLP5_9ACTN|nr:hypothetical protein EBO15_37075 [Actinomadura harenae]